jgi:Ca2+-binding EF-hand superfamily protein
MQRTGKPSQPVDPKAEEKSIATAFAMFDVDGSGDIDSSELKKVAQELGVPMSEEDIAAAMAVMDGAGKKRLFAPFYALNLKICQDRLGTNVRKS